MLESWTRKPKVVGWSLRSGRDCGGVGWGGVGGGGEVGGGGGECTALSPPSIPRLRCP